MANMASTMNDWSVVKAKIFTPKHNFYGLMVAFLDNLNHSIENMTLVFSIYSETHEIPLDGKWNEFEKKIQDMIYGGNFSQTITMTTMDKLKDDIMENSFGTELLRNINNQDNGMVNQQFAEKISKILNDPQVQVDCQYESITSEELAKGRIREEKPADQGSNAGIATPSNFRLVNAKLILAPVDGKLITDLKEGDTIMVNLIVMSMAENHIIDKLKLRKPDGSAKPAPAKITKIQPYGKGYQLLVHFVDNYYAKIIEEERILVKTFTAVDPKRSAVKSGGQKPKKGLPVLSIALAIVLLLIIGYVLTMGH